jgi:hypothetical protein
VDSDVHDPAGLLAAAGELLDLSEPVAVIFSGILGHVVDHAEAVSIVRTVLAGVPSGSYLLHQDGADTDRANVTAHDTYVEHGAISYTVRSPEQITAYFAGLELVDPGVVPITRWRPDTLRPVGGPDEPELAQYGGIGRKP